jgi:hypothetical protein
MNAARDLLADLEQIGARLEPFGDRLILRAGPRMIPAALVRRVREAKADLLATLIVCPDRTAFRGYENKEPCENPSDHQARDRTFESRVNKWLNQHLIPSAPGRCAWCGKPELPGAVVLPFGTEPASHTWLHAECWPTWYQARREEAIAALRTMGE